jgi:hypothetical protein
VLRPARLPRCQRCWGACLASDAQRMCCAAVSADVRGCAGLSGDVRGCAGTWQACTQHLPNAKEGTSHGLPAKGPAASGFVLSSTRVAVTMSLSATGSRNAPKADDAFCGQAGSGRALLAGK